VGAACTTTTGAQAFASRCGDSARLVVMLVAVGVVGQVQQWWPWTQPVESPTAGTGDTTGGSPTDTAGTPTPTPTVKSPTPAPGEVDLTQYITTVSASSYLAPSKDGKLTYVPDHLFDGDLSTAWSEGVKGDGVGEYVEIVFDRPVVITQVHVANGYQKDQNVFDRNSLPTSLGLRLSDGTYGEASLANTRFGFWNTLSMSPSLQVQTTSVRVVIVATRPGTHYSDTTISEIGLWGHL